MHDPFEAAGTNYSSNVVGSCQDFLVPLGLFYIQTQHLWQPFPASLYTGLTRFQTDIHSPHGKTSKKTYISCYHLIVLNLMLICHENVFLYSTSYHADILYNNCMNLPKLHHISVDF